MTDSDILFRLTILEAVDYNYHTSGHSSVVERLVANEKVEGSSPFARSINYE